MNRAYIPNKSKPSYEKGVSTMYLLQYKLPKQSICVSSSQFTVFELKTNLKLDRYKNNYT